MWVALMFVAALWPVILLAWAIAIAEAIERRGRFSVRTLLIVTTLVAVGVGIICFSEVGQIRGNDG